MQHAAATIRDYDPATDTASIDVPGLGEIQSRFAGVKVDVSVNRGYLVSGAQGVLSLPDAHRWDDAAVIAVQPPTKLGSAVGSSVQRYQTGRAPQALDGSGAATGTITYPLAFSATPNALDLSLDNLGLVTITGVSSTGFSVSITGGTPNSTTYLTWAAKGNA